MRNVECGMRNEKKGLKELFSGRTKGVLLYTARRDAQNRSSLLFTNPVKEITCINPASLNRAFSTVEKWLKKGYYAAGYVSFEAGYFLNQKTFKKIKACPAPLLYFGIFNKPRAIRNLPGHGTGFWLRNFKPGVGAAEFSRVFRRVKKNLSLGEYYQVNYCFNNSFDLTGSLGSLFCEAVSRQESSYCAFISDGARQVLSFSPELFFRAEGRGITMKPMKGTALKGTGRRNELSAGKNRAENLMIVDLIRNDLGRICETDSVKAPRLFDIEEYKTLYQMTSTVTGRLKRNIGLTGIFRALFPSGSVTGAPKIRAMKEIAQLEKSGRGIYTGAIGFAAPGGRMVFNIPIRTAVISGGKGSAGAGSGMVYDSSAQKEYRECLGKLNFLRSCSGREALIESLLLKEGEYLLEKEHLDRMEKSARYFGIKFSRRKAQKKLNAIKSRGSFKARLLLYADGAMAAEKAPRAEKGGALRAMLSNKHVDRENIFLFHKTTLRGFYNAELKKNQAKGYDDVVFLNAQGEVCEGAKSNILVEKNGIFYTPPVQSGLLPGTYRGYLLKTMPRLFREKVLFKKDLLNADNIYLCNSVTGIRKTLIKL